mmetsp:Transcript_32744/g.63130  ORF Transcript_32744/g.63130 Transcript_32744/m.63130 type:complete len:393 (-) Transcript_32744:9-1187(-)
MKKRSGGDAGRKLLDRSKGGVNTYQSVSSGGYQTSSSKGESAGLTCVTEFDHEYDPNSTRLYVPTKFGKVKGEPVVMQTQIKISFIENIDTANSKFSVKAFIECKWYDEKFFNDQTEQSEEGKEKDQGKSKKAKKIDLKKKEAKYWKPKIKMKNTSKEKMEFNYGILDKWQGDPRTGVMEIRYSYQGDVIARLDLRKFPFDHHDLVVSLHFMDKDKRIWIVADPHTTNGKVKVRSSEWTLKEDGIDLERGWSDPDDSTSRNLYPGVRARIHIAREYSYYLYNIVFMVVMLCSMTFGVVCIPPDDLGDRSSMVLTIILTCVALKLTIAECTPKIPYLTIMDKFLVSQMGIIYVMFCMNCFVARVLVPRYSMDTVQNIDDVLSAIWMVLFIGKR